MTWSADILSALSAKREQVVELRRIMKSLRRHADKDVRGSGDARV
jgi:hypothetical protein